MSDPSTVLIFVDEGLKHQITGIISLVFFYLNKLLFSDFFQFKGNFCTCMAKITQNTTTMLQMFAAPSFWVFRKNFQRILQKQGMKFKLNTMVTSKLI